MAWQTPKTNWQENNALTPTDFNRIEGNIQHLQDTKETPAGAQAKVNTHAGSKQTHGISSSYYIAKTSRSDQLPAWNDIQGKPSLVTSSDLSNGLAAKVDKPTSATSGNIAVFDGGPGKLKDGRLSINALTWVKPGNNIAVSHLPEESFTGSPSTVGPTPGLMFSPIRPGKYRITGEIKARENYTGSVEVGIFLLHSRSNVGRLEPATDKFSTTSTSYVTFTLDMYRPVAYGGIIYIYVTRAAVRNIRLRYADDFNPVPEFLGRS